MANTPEYLTITKCTPELTNAVKDDLVELSGELFAEGLIAAGNVADLTNQFIGAAHRAAQLVGFVRNRVSLDTTNYIIFIKVLMKRLNDHENILLILEEKYKSLGELCMLSSQYLTRRTLAVKSSTFNSLALAV